MPRYRPEIPQRLCLGLPVPLPVTPDGVHAAAWLPDGRRDDAAPVLWILGGSTSMCRSVLGVGDAETLAVDTVRGLVAGGTLPHGSCVLALGARDGYSCADVTTPELAYEDLGRAARAARDLLVRAERVALGREADPARRVACGVSYGGTVTARAFQLDPGLADAWALVSGLPWNRTHMARDVAAEADALAGALARNRDARLALATGDRDPTRDGMAAIHAVLAAAHPEVAGRTCLVTRPGRHEPVAFCDQLRESLRALRDMAGGDDPV